MEAEAREILAASVGISSTGTGLGTRIHLRFAAAGGADLEFPSRSEPPRDPDLAE